MSKVDAKIFYGSNTSIEELVNMKPATRKKRICEIDSIENLSPTKEGVELNEGYDYSINGSIPQLADSIAKLAIEFDKNQDMGEKAGEMFITLIVHYYEQSKNN